MSIKSITPLPAGTPEESNDSTAMPDLSALRQGWSKKPSVSKPLPSIPSDSSDASLGAPPQTETAKIPALPNPVTSSANQQEEFNIDSLDHLLASVYPEQAKRSPSLQASNLTGKKEPLPQMEFALPGDVSQKPAEPKLPAMEAMPITDEPRVSLPLARDQFVFPIEQDTTPAPVAQEPVKEEKEEEVITPSIPARSEEPAEEEEMEAAFADTREHSPLSQPDTTEPPDYTDEDLRDALRPMVDQTVDKFLYTPSQGIHTYLEPMLRSTVRRAIAEQMDDVSPFQDVSGWDKFAWKMRALFSSRSYEDMVFDYTKRYQVEEVYLLRRHTRSLISYASNDPSRHAQAKKVQGTVKKIASKCNGKAKDGEPEPPLKWEEKRQLIIRRGEHCTLVAIVNGSSNAILKSDLDYALRQAEERFGKSLEEENDIHLQILQPLLEGCLLIKAPAIPN